MMASTGQILLEITTNESSYATERRFPESMTIAELKNRLEIITGASAGTMKLSFHDTTGALLGEGDDDAKSVGDYAPAGAERLQLRVKDENVIRCDDLSGVSKYEMSAEEYEKRGESVLAFKARNKLGRFSDSAAAAAASAENEKIDHIKVGDRCEVTVKGVNPRRGQVKFVGRLPEKPGFFVGVHYDEPCGKNDGTFQGVRWVF